MTPDDRQQHQDDELLEIASRALAQADYRPMTEKEITALRFLAGLPEHRPEPAPNLTFPFTTL